MKINYRIVIPALAIALTASAAIAQLPRDRVLPIAANPGPRTAQFCDDMKARQAARFTFIEERLKLTPAQKPLFDRWKTATESVAAEREANCGKARAARDAGTRHSLTERNNRMEERLKTRLANLEKTRGPQEALYNALSDDQKKLFARGAGRGGFGMRQARMRGPMGRGFHGRGFGRPGFGGPGFGGRSPGGPGMNGGQGPNPPPT
jgi:hypothetical protein